MEVKVLVVPGRVARQKAEAAHPVGTHRGAEQACFDKTVQRAVKRDPVDRLGQRRLQLRMAECDRRLLEELQHGQPVRGDTKPNGSQPLATLPVTVIVGRCLGSGS